MTPRRLAERIAATLFVNGASQCAQRLVLELPGGRDGGGWCQGAVADVIEQALLEFPVNATAPARARVAGGTKRQKTKG